MCRSVDGVPRSLARFNAIAAAQQIERHALKVAEAETQLPARSRDVPDRRQLIGLPVFVIQTPSWPRENWAEPQRRRTRPRRV